mgnify:FL=1
MVFTFQGDIDANGGDITADNFSGSSSGTNTGDQTNISGNAATATQWGTSAGYANFSSTAISSSVGWLFGTTGNGTYAPVAISSVSSLLNLSGTNTGDQTLSSLGALPIAGGTMTGTLQADVIKDSLYLNAGNSGWKTKKWVRNVGVSGGSINQKWVKVLDVPLTASAYTKTAVKMKIHGYDDVSSGTENIDVRYENASTAQEYHEAYWYTTDNTPNIFSEVRSIRYESDGLTNSYQVWVKMAGDWRDTFTVEAEYWISGTDTISFPTEAGTATAPSGDSNDIALTTRSWKLNNSSVYIGSAQVATQSYVTGQGYQTSQRAISSTPTDGATTTSISSDWAFDNVKTAVPASAVFTDTVNTFDGAYGSLSGAPSLGSAALTASSSYATSAQGTTADAALPKSGGTMTGALVGTSATFGGLVTTKTYKTTSAYISNSYVRIAEIDDIGGMISSTVRVTMTAHGSSHVTMCNAIISVGHSQDILIESSNLDYTQVTLKVDSNSNGQWTLSVKSSSANSTNYQFDIQGLSNNLTITLLPTTSQTGTTLEHTTNFGTNITSTGGTMYNKFGGKLFLSSVDANTTSVTALVLDGDEVEKRTLGSNAFNSTAIPSGNAIIDWTADQGTTNIHSGNYTDTNTTYTVQDGELSENNFTDADHTKLNGIEAGATTDQDLSGYLTTTGKAADSNLLDGLDSTRFYRTVTSSSGTAGAGWVTVAKNQSGRRHGEVIVSDGDSGDHAFIRIDWMRSYADSNFSVINVGGHSNRITGVRVLSQSSDATYGWKYLQVYVTVSSEYGVKINSLGAPHGYGSHTAVTPVVQDTLSGYVVYGNAVTGLENATIAAEEGIVAGGVIYASGGNSSNWNTAYTHSQATHAPTDANNYVHPTTAGNKHVPTGGSAGEFLKYSASGTAVWATPSYTTNTNTQLSEAEVRASFTAGTNVSITNGVISSTDTDTVYTLPSAIPATSVTIGNGVTLSESADRADLLMIKSSTSTWGGLQISNTSDEIIFSLMGDGTKGGIYDDQNGEWLIDWTENAGVSLFYNASAKLITTSTGVSITGALVASGDITAFSDARVKENVETIPNALDKVKAMRGVGYNKIGADTQSVGVIAQELEEVVPQLVHTDEEGMKSVAYGNITAVLIEAIKEQQVQIEELKARLDGLTK